MADWKAHKPFCIPPDKLLDKSRSANENLSLAFVKDHYCIIMREILTKTEETGLDKRELALELGSRICPSVA